MPIRPLNFAVWNCGQSNTGNTSGEIEIAHTAQRSFDFRPTKSNLSQLHTVNLSDTCSLLHSSLSLPLSLFPSLRLCVSASLRLDPPVLSCFLLIIVQFYCILSHSFSFVVIRFLSSRFRIPFPHLVSSSSFPLFDSCSCSLTDLFPFPFVLHVSRSISRTPG